MRPRYNEPLFNEVLGITNNFVYPRNSKTYEKEPRNLIHELGRSWYRGSNVAVIWQGQLQDNYLRNN